MRVRIASPVSPASGNRRQGVGSRRDASSSGRLRSRCDTTGIPSRTGTTAGAVHAASSHLPEPPRPGRAVKQRCALDNAAPLADHRPPSANGSPAMSRTEVRARRRRNAADCSRQSIVRGSLFRPCRRVGDSTKGQGLVSYMLPSHFRPLPCERRSRVACATFRELSRSPAAAPNARAGWASCSTSTLALANCYPKSCSEIAP